VLINLGWCPLAPNTGHASGVGFGAEPGREAVANGVPGHSPREFLKFIVEIGAF